MDTDTCKIDSYEQQLACLAEEVRDIKLSIEVVLVAMRSMMTLLEAVQCKVAPDMVVYKSPSLGLSRDDPTAVDNFYDVAASPRLHPCATPFELQHEVDTYAEDYFASSMAESDMGDEEYLS